MNQHRWKLRTEKDQLKKIQIAINAKTSQQKQALAEKFEQDQETRLREFYGSDLGLHAAPF